MKKVVVTTAIVVALLVGFLVGQSRNNTDTISPQTVTENVQEATGSKVNALISYDLPDGWGEKECPGREDTVFMLPPGTTLNCEADPSAPVKIAVDNANYRDCNQLQNVQNARKHVCISEYINGHRSLKAQTIYNQDSSYKRDTTLDAYYIDIGKAVIKVEYIYNDTNTYQAGWESLAKSVKAR